MVTAVARHAHRALADIRLIVSLCACLTLSGCGPLGRWIQNDFKVGPDYRAPATEVTEKWIDADNLNVRPGNPNLASWWDIFDDPVLTRLIHQAASQNLTARQAGLQIIRANIQRRIAVSELLPQGQSVSAGYTHGVVSRNNGVSPSGGPAFGTALAPSVSPPPLSTATTPIAGATPTNIAGTTTTGTSPLLNSSIGAGGSGSVVLPGEQSRFFDSVGSSFNLAWELDFWGLLRRNLEAAEASLDQSMQNYDAIMVQLLANVATQYVEIRTLQRRLELAHQNVQLQEPLVGKLEQQYLAGVATSKPAYFQLKSNLDNTKALIPPLEITLRQANNQLCVLLGITVQDLLPQLGDSRVADPKDPGKQIRHIPRSKDDRVVLSISGDLLLCRPDVQAMERQLRIQSAQIGIAEAEMLPHIGINGSVGLAANEFNRLFNQQSMAGSIGPSLTWNILNYGRLLANVRTQNSLYQQYVLAYQQAVLNANQDVENSLVAYLQTLEQSRHLKDSANGAVEVTDYYYTQLSEGFLPAAATSLTFYNQVFTTINFRVQQQDASAQSEGNIALNLILLYRALGGGWQIRLNDANHPDSQFSPRWDPESDSSGEVQLQTSLPPAPGATVEGIGAQASDEPNEPVHDDTARGQE
jgi:NodT family efflux transporter outer membrane factor (OMF) lipoprotein